jgi:cell wall-associated NlpC family hydrolase
MSDSHTDSRIKEEYTRSRIIEEARSYIGVPWKHRGRSRTGIDCLGLVLEVGSKFGLHDYPDDVHYTRQSSGQELITPFIRHGKRVTDFKDLKDGDVLIMKDRFFPHHVGFIASKGGTRTLIHACVHQRKVVEDVLTEDRYRKIITAFKFKEL